uniref:Piwi domain-containing protein n=2 Tax=Wuchereria bancrofti TaxID=6293 RepID=A0AAF5PZW2_WUCBA
MKGRGRGRRKESLPESEATASTTVGKGYGRGKKQEFTTFSGESAKVGQKHGEQHERIKELAHRPNHGKLGEPIQLTANFKLLQVPPSLQIYCYHVDVLKITKNGRLVVENRDVCREIFWKVISNNEKIFGTGYSLVYDDCHTVYSLKKLKTEKPTLELQLFVEPVPCLKAPSVSFLLSISVTNYFTVTVDEQLPNFRASMQFLDCLVSQKVRCPYMSIASSFYPFNQCMYIKPCESIPYKVLNMGPGMEAWTGLYGAVKRCEKGLMLNVDVSTKVFYKIDIWLIDFYLDVLNEFVGRRRPYDIDAVSETFALSANQRQQLRDAMKGLTLKLTYDNRHVKFIDVGLPARTQRFRMKRSEDFIEELTVEEYFNRYKNIRLKFPNLPVLHCGTLKRQDYFPMELLRLSDKVQRVKRRLTPFQIAKLIRGTALSPLERFEKIDWFLKEMRISTDDEFIQQFGVVFPSVSNGVPESVRILGRILPSPAIKFKTIELPSTNGSWCLKGDLFQTATNVHFAVVFVDQAINMQNFREPFNTLIGACKLFGMKFVRENFGADTVEIYRWDTRREEADIYVRSFKKVCDEIREEALKPLMIFITPEKNDDIYGRIKVTCDKEEGVACQVILAETFLKMFGNPERNAVSHNICLKINVKLDGINNEVARNQNYWKKFTDKEAPTLFMGIDVTHPPSGDTSVPSIASIIGSLNISATKYAASLKIQQPGVEVMTYAVDAFRACIMKFGEQAGCKPQHIVLFRDGVSDSQFLDVMNDELLCLKTAIYQLDRCYCPTLSYVVVQKRHHTRFIEPTLKRDKRNVPPGTVVDSTITNPLRFDFYLCSHRGAVGTSRPSHYTVLYDSWHLSADEWQQMIYALCHVYARCNKSVSIPAPVYYAHLACDRARRLLKYTRISEPLRNESNVHILEQSFALNPDTPNMYFI